MSDADSSQIARKWKQELHPKPDKPSTPDVCPLPDSPPCSDSMVTRMTLPNGRKATL
ncbi:hypothetical protein Enr13x_75390 [Stieleria neptunia]|uniref:Uncharacterized protein n=1 Tax=Stieleria neptunia TaxID=2527979 RepID=A0A518I3K1_9BACT|nr:hypothetical protein [Stieleria neptunia]QDV47628.1 hypothetical protein Enr13x_75390 [Stieleria neptunia]